MTLFAHGAQIAANATKGGRPVLAAKGSRDLLLDFDHPQITLGLIVRKWQRKVVEKGQHLVRSSQQVV